MTTGQRLAEELGVSLRTVYRDIAALQASGVPIEGEGGAGYRLPRRFDLPPLMFTVDEAEALALGLAVSAAWADPLLAEAARSARAKLLGGYSAELKARLKHSALLAPAVHVPEELKAPLGDLRRAIRDRCRLAVRYLDRDGAASERILRPLGLVFWGRTWTLVAWCELRGAFRAFSVDRLQAWEPRDAFPEEPGRRLEDYLREIRGAAR